MMTTPDPVPDEPMTTARRPPNMTVHYYRADPERPHKRTACCGRERVDLPHDGHTATTTDWSLVTCPERVQP